jgi:Protein of unknown function (DUF2001).
MGYLLANDGLKGKAGSAFMVKNGRNVELFGLKKFEANAEFETSEFPVVGALVNQTKVKGVKYSGSLTIYYGTPEFLDVLTEFKRTGKLPEINFQVINQDKGASVGDQIVAIYGVTLSKVPIAMLDDSVDYLQEEIPFSFTDYETLESFHAPLQLGGN